MAARTLRDPWAVAIGALSGGMAWRIGTRPAAAAGLGVVVMMVKVVAGRLIPPERQEKHDEETPSPPPDSLVFRRDGDQWTVGSGDAACRFPDHQGLAYLHVLVSNPGYAFAVGELVGKSEPSSGQGWEPTQPNGVPDDAGVEAGYRQRRERLLHDIADLELELKDAEETGDGQQAARVEREIKRKRKELLQLDVNYGIVSAIERIAGRDPVVGGHLRTSVQLTDTPFYSYAPDAGAPTWKL